jgi:hypothetical protein
MATNFKSLTKASKIILGLISATLLIFFAIIIFFFSNKFKTLETQIASQSSPTPTPIITNNLEATNEADLEVNAGVLGTETEDNLDEEEIEEETTPTPEPTPTSTPESTPTPTPTPTPTTAPLVPLLGMLLEAFPFIPFEVTEVEIDADPLVSHTCPTTFTWVAEITSNKAGTVEYEWKRSDLSVPITGTLEFDEAGTLPLTSTPWTLSTNGLFYKRLTITSPEGIDPIEKTISLNCL